jgi:ABC-type antimicrobial peptide transport system permease subunit
MTSGRLIARSLRFHARSHLGVLLGTAVASAVLVGALVVGDSVRVSLERLALLRLGGVEFALATGDRLFRAQLANDLRFSLAQTGRGLSVAVPVLNLPAVATTGDGAARANHVQVLGVPIAFWQLAGQPPALGNLPTDGVMLNRPLAAQLKVKAGDTILLRVAKPAALSRDAPLSPQEDTTVALRLRVSAVIADEQFGRFSLVAGAVAPFNAFVSLATLEAKTGAQGQANLLLVGDDPNSPNRAPAPATVMLATPPGSRFAVPVATPLGTAGSNDLSALLQRSCQLADEELELRPLPAAGAVELRTRRVFLDAPIAAAVFDRTGGSNSVTGLLARMAPGVRPAGVLTYFVNELRVGDHAAPYSMITAIGPPVAPADLRDDEILITQWLADDLGARAGDDLTLKYFVVGTLRRLEERATRFRVRGVLPMNAPGLDRDLMPDFPGMTDAANCRDWDTGLAIDTGRIRAKDEEYWRRYRGTPKAFVSLAAGQKLWQNRFGNLTAIRFYTPDSPALSLAAVNLSLRQGLDPALFGLTFQPVRQQALAAAAQSQDFGGLFLAFSFFLIAAAVLLMAVLFQFGIEQRGAEVGTLLALGFRPGRVRRLLLTESGVVAALGAGAGIVGGLAYSRALLHGLQTVWSDAIGGVPLHFYARPTTLVMGATITVLVSWLAMRLALGRQMRRTARQLLADGGLEELPAEAAGAGWARWLALGTGLAAVLLVAVAFIRRDTANAGLFFGAGGLVLVAGLAAGFAGLRSLAATESAARLTVTSLGIRNATRQRRRSLAVMALLACGSFLIVAIGVFRLDAVTDASKRSSGTGGFALIGETTQPVTEDLDSALGRDAFGLDTNALAGVSVVPFRVHAGDEASCLNLNHPQQPRLLGVNPELLARRGAFTFAEVWKGPGPDNPWTLLTDNTGMATDEIPAIGDAASIEWSLGKKVGDAITVTDERGRPLKLRLVAALANSMLQGNLVIAENAFTARFPSATGYQLFLVDAPAGGADRAAAELTRGLRDLGLELTPAVKRLTAFNAVQNTYLGTFQVLGGLGLLLGSAGLGVVVLRNVLERRAELALLLAVGWRRPAVRRLVLAEHGGLLVTGLGLGVLAAVVAVMPALLTPGRVAPYRSLLLTLAAVLANGALWTWLATRVALRGRLLDALRNE